MTVSITYPKWNDIFLTRLAENGFGVSEKARSALECVNHIAPTVHVPMGWNWLFASLIASNTNIAAALEMAGCDIRGLFKQLVIGEPMILIEELRPDKHPEQNDEFIDLLLEGCINSADSQDRKFLTSGDILNCLFRYPCQDDHRGINMLSLFGVADEIGVALIRTTRKLRQLFPSCEEQRYLLGYEDNRFSFHNVGLLTPGNAAGHAPADAAIPIVSQVFERNVWATRNEIAEFEALLNTERIREDAFQRFFEEHPDFLLGYEYKTLYPHVMLRSGKGGILIPDFLIERVDTNLCDIIDLKRPDERIIAGPPKRRGLSAALTRALNQLREYREALEDPEVRIELERRTGLRAYKPSICVVIGRSRAWFSSEERIKVMEEYKHLKVLTYDDLLGMAKRRYAVMLGKKGIQVE